MHVETQQKSMRTERIWNVNNLNIASLLIENTVNKNFNINIEPFFI